MRVGCRRTTPADDVIDVSIVPDPGAELMALYDRALPEVYGYLLARCSDRTLAQDLTAETFLAAVAARDAAPSTVGWLIGIARHKLADHWRWQARQQRLLESVAGSAPTQDDPWDVALDVLRARQILGGLAPQHRAALTLRYLDGLSVAETAGVLELPAPELPRLIEKGPFDS